MGATCYNLVLPTSAFIRLTNLFWAILMRLIVLNKFNLIYKFSQFLLSRHCKLAFADTIHRIIKAMYV